MMSYIISVGEMVSMLTIVWIRDGRCRDSSSMLKLIALL